MLKQYVNGKVYRSVNANMSEADLTIFKGLLAGEIKEYNLESSGGSSAVTPPQPNRVNFGVGAVVGVNQRQSAAIYINHMPETVTSSELKTAVIGTFDASFDVDTVCEDMRIFYDKSAV